MAGGLAVLLGVAALGALTFPWRSPSSSSRSCLIATLQAFIFSILAAIYLGGGHVTDPLDQGAGQMD